LRGNDQLAVLDHAIDWHQDLCMAAGLIHNDCHEVVCLAPEPSVR
jgi:hypothetical protein